MLSFEEFLTLIPKDKVYSVKKFEKAFYVMFKPGKFSVCTVGFLIDFKNDDNPSSETWKEAAEIISFFKPNHAWIGTRKNMDDFEKKYPNITVESYSFFGENGFLPVAVIPFEMLNVFQSKMKEKK